MLGVLARWPDFRENRSAIIPDGLTLYSGLREANCLFERWDTDHFIISVAGLFLEEQNNDNKNFDPVFRFIIPLSHYGTGKKLFSRMETGLSCFYSEFFEAGMGQMAVLITGMQDQVRGVIGEIFTFEGLKL